MWLRLRNVLSFLLLPFLFSCTTPPPDPPAETFLSVYRFGPPALVEFSEEYQVRSEIPFIPPPSCSLLDVFSPARGRFLAIELSCPNGQTVLFLDSTSAAVTQPVSTSDSHFLAWAPDGGSAYLKADSLGSPHVVRSFTDGRREVLDVPEFTYDLAPSPQEGQFTLTFSQGLGRGSELWLAARLGKDRRLLYADPLHYISFARFSPDGSQIAFIKVPDTGTPFTAGELWVMQADGSHPRKLAGADAGHGYAANWSPDGKRIAFVVRENPEEERANRSAEALISNIYLAEPAGGALTQVTDLEQGRAETPFWSPHGNTLAFNVVINDRMEVRVADLTTGEIRSLLTEFTCCPAWLQK